MKNVIAITACLKRCSVAISYQGGIFQINEAADAPTNLAFFTQKLIRANNIDLKKIEGIITASGPGSFTGIRTAQSLAKALAFALNVPSASVDYFDVIENMAATKRSANKARLIIIKSEKNQVYFKKIRNECETAGVASYKDVAKEAEADIELIGENIPEVLRRIENPKVAYEEVNDFRNAARLLAFLEKITSVSKISPLYINAAM